MNKPLIVAGLEEALGNISVEELRSALNTQLRAVTAYAEKYPWITAIYEGFVVVTAGDKHYRHDYTVDGSTVKLSLTGEEVRQSWVTDTVTTELVESESGRPKTEKRIGLSEAFVPTAPNDKGVSEACVLLRAGKNKTAQKGLPGGREYTADFIREHLPRFEGGMCHVDHPTLSESKERPERTMGTLAAVVKNARWDATEKAAVGDVHYLGTDAGRNMREAFADDVVREKAGLSIYWGGGVKVRRKKLGESYVDVPVELLGDGQFNVDFVTRPNAGGKVGPLKESEEDMLITDLTKEMLEAERPDLVAALREAAPLAKPEAKDEAKRVQATGMSEAERTEFEALKVRARKSDAKDIVTAKLAEAKLPEAAAQIVRAHFAEAECADAAVFTPLVEAEIATVKGAFESYRPAGVVRGIGAEPRVEGGAQTVNVLQVMAESMGLAKPAADSK